MEFRRRQFLHLAATAAGLSVLPRVARAQGYPDKFIKLLLPFTAGSPNDVLARLVTPALSSILGRLSSSRTGQAAAHRSERAP